MGRREQREELQASWNVYEPEVRGRPFSKRDMRDANERERQKAAAEVLLSEIQPSGADELSAMLPRTLLARTLRGGRR